MGSCRWGKIVAVSAIVAALVAAREAGAAAEVHRFNLVLSATPTQVDGGDFNTTIDFINRTALEPRGLEGLKRVTFAWLFDAQLSYFVRQNMALRFGVGQIRAKSDREYLPTLNAAVQLHNEMLSVPVSVGGAYYLAPYNQGDFQARAYLGVGVVSMVYNRVVFQQEVQGIPDVPTVFSVGTADSPGYYAETGAHMFFASRFSVLLGVQYRSAKIRHIADATTGIPFRAPNGDPYTLDLSGLGAKFAVGIGL